MTDLPGNAEGVVRPWPYAHSMDELDRCWNAYVEATVTEGHPLVGTFVPLIQAGVQPYQLSLIFDLALTVADDLFDEAITDIQRGGPPGTVR
jgi:hypothetical protein